MPISDEVLKDCGIRFSSCPECGSVWFPERRFCARCLNESLRSTESGHLAQVYASTKVQVSSGSRVAPYVLAYVEVDGVRFMARGADPEFMPGPADTIRLACETEEDDGRHGIVFVEQQTAVGSERA